MRPIVTWSTQGVGTGTVIIGAGPAGLSMAVCLARRGHPYVLLEAGDAP